jgi:hypothetical protein
VSINTILQLLVLLLWFKGGCDTGERALHAYEELRKRQPIEQRDSLYVAYTVREWARLDWQTYGVRADLEYLTLEEITHYVEAAFYSPDRRKALFWVGERKPNALSRSNEGRKICPNSGDTIYGMDAVIGFRVHTDQPWQLYPFQDLMCICYPDSLSMLPIMDRFYFKGLKKKEMYRIAQSGPRKGHKVLAAYGYNIQDEAFWDKCWLFERDTVGSYGLYNFQVLGYDYIGDPCTPASAEPWKSPVLDYPAEIKQLYPGWK